MAPFWWCYGIISVMLKTEPYHYICHYKGPKMKREQREMQTWYAARELEVATPAELLPPFGTLLLSVPASVWVDEKKRSVAWKEEPLDAMRHPSRKDGTPYPPENCFPDFLALAQAQSLLPVGDFVEKWGPLRLYPNPCEVDEQAAMCEPADLYIQRAQWCQGVLDLSIAFEEGSKGKQEDWNKIQLKNRFLSPLQDFDIRGLKFNLLTEVSLKLSEAGVTPFLQEREGKIILTVSYITNVPLIRTWDKAQQDGEPLQIYTPDSNDPSGFFSSPMPRPSILWSAIVWRVATILANARGVRHCQNCKAPFAPIHNNQRYCSECGEKSERNLQRVAKHRAKKQTQAAGATEAVPKREHEQM
jgi:hypothetical protein